MRDLSVQIRHLDRITVDQTKSAHACSSQVSRGWTSQPADSHDEHLGVLQSQLPV